MEAKVQLSAPDTTPVTVTLNTDVGTLVRLAEALATGKYHSSLEPLQRALGDAVNRAKSEWNSEVSRDGS